MAQWADIRKGDVIQFGTHANVKVVEISINGQSVEITTTDNEKIVSDTDVLAIIVGSWHEQLVEEKDGRLTEDGQFRVERPGWNYRTRLYSKEQAIDRAQEVLEQFKDDNYVLLINENKYIAATVWRQ